MDPHIALQILDDTVARIQLLVNNEGLSIGLTRKEQVTLIKASQAVKQALPATKPTTVPDVD